MYPCTQFQLIWRTSFFGTKFSQKQFKGGALGQTQPDNNFFFIVTFTRLNVKNLQSPGNLN